MGRIGTGWRLTKVSLGVIRNDKELLLFPLLGVLISGLMWGLFLASLLFFDLFASLQAISPYLYYGMYFLFYFLTAFIAVYFQAAVVGSALIRLDGGSPSLGDGFREANKHLGQLFKWALVTATVGLILRAISNQAGILGRLIAGALGVTWALATYMAVPIIVTEGLGPWGALKRSASLFRRTWGETVIGGLGLGLILFGLALLGMLPLVAGIYLLSAGATFLGFVLVGVGGIYLLAIFLLWGAAWPVLSAVLYRYAAEGKAAPGIPGDVLFGSVTSSG